MFRYIAYDIASNPKMRPKDIIENMEERDSHVQGGTSRLGRSCRESVCLSERKTRSACYTSMLLFGVHLCR